jgi:2-oxo-4-hydroxy-4-carboxy-5-ureidoimidazoline decarboxylase
MSRFTIAEVNELSDVAFVAAFGDIAEHSPWVAERAAAKRPFATRETFIQAFVDAVAAAAPDAKLALIRAHPDLAGKAALRGELTEDSKSEQAGAGLGSLSPAEFARFTALNDIYKARFGFPFIFAVKGATKSMILAAFEERILHSPETEFATALTQVGRIFRFRIEAKILP